ncbi:MAG: M15 family metallopeptidase [Spirochaetaceae bacterium]|jgi:D-alanyl-D-alanine carboxypeptidase|nr:M15 family metallopeptidase [Spirochaetaceae bacterium]
MPKTVLWALLLCGCVRPEPRSAEPLTPENSKLRIVLEHAEIPLELASEIRAHETDFLATLDAVSGKDIFLRMLVDKQHPIEPLKYKPQDLVELTNEGAFRVPRSRMLLRYPAAVALETMAQAARADGVTLVASSTWRSYEYQIEVYARNVKQNGQETADRESARPGYSQHQLGLVIDFGSITDAFAETPAGKWLTEHAGEYGWSLSFPQGYEAVTGYRWECWHYRYVGIPLIGFIDAWFGGIQQYALRFLHEWEHYQPSALPAGSSAALPSVSTRDAISLN